MELLVLVWRQYRWPFISVMALSLASAALGIGLIAFINQRLIETADTSLLVLPEFLGLLLLLMAVTLGSQLALTTLGHHFVYRLRSEFIKRILDTHVERIEQLGSASLLAGKPILIFIFLGIKIKFRSFSIKFFKLNFWEANLF